MKKTLMMCAAALLSLGSMTAKNSTTLPIQGEVVKANNPMIQYIGRVSFAQPEVASFNFPGTTIQTRFQALRSR